MYNQPMNKGHPREIQNMGFKDMWSLFGGHIFNLIYGKLSKY